MDDPKTNKRINVVFISHFELLFKKSLQLGSNNQIWCDHDPIIHMYGQNDEIIIIMTLGVYSWICFNLFKIDVMKKNVQSFIPYS
jgi:hypothetical protein